MNCAAPQPANAPFTVACASGDHWGLAAKACLEGLAGQPANVGFLYVTEGFNQNLSSILTFLRETTRIDHWVGAVVPMLMAGDRVLGPEGGMAVMTGMLPPGSCRAFHSLDGGQPLEVGDGLVVAYGDPRSPGVDSVMQGLSGGTGTMVGALVSSSGPPAQLADTVVSGGIAGLILAPSVATVTGLSQGCSPIGPPHRVTAASEGVVMGLDGHPAVEALKQDAGQLIARDLRRAAGYIHVGLPAADGAVGGYLVRMLLGIDPRQGWLAVGDHLEEGQELLFVRRDPQTARADMQRMLADVVARIGGRRVRAALYHSCIARGSHMFGSDDAEAAMIRAALGPVPLIGFFGHGEFGGRRLYTYTGVLTVLVEDGP
ncbi:MAG: FIST C-terminal domain-containing protein [Bacteroidales bacterium]